MPIGRTDPRRARPRDAVVSEDLSQYLEANKFDLSKFGDDPEVPLRELSSELMRGSPEAFSANSSARNP